MDLHFVYILWYRGNPFAKFFFQKVVLCKKLMALLLLSEKDIFGYFRMNIRTNNDVEALIIIFVLNIFE